ncbi:hypothetical protein M231_01842 [Tremella mesenterica]|uniref:Uncharacterized protein n=1 Tax=Tremella mesenterica TaxID=5217 RepID=A0A4Q1BS17_TREME|nr:hypothetical protein M231_01842 [Tremella mesenterica]
MTLNEWLRELAASGNLPRDAETNALDHPLYDEKPVIIFPLSKVVKATPKTTPLLQPISSQTLPFPDLLPQIAHNKDISNTSNTQSHLDDLVRSAPSPTNRHARTHSQPINIPHAPLTNNDKTSSSNTPPADSVPSDPLEDPSSSCPNTHASQLSSGEKGWPIIPLPRPASGQVTATNSVEEEREAAREAQIHAALSNPRLTYPIPFSTPKYTTSPDLMMGIRPPNSSCDTPFQTNDDELLQQGWTTDSIHTWRSTILDRQMSESTSSDSYAGFTSPSDGEDPTKTPIAYDFGSDMPTTSPKRSNGITRVSGTPRHGTLSPGDFLDDLGLKDGFQSQPSSEMVWANRGITRMSVVTAGKALSLATQSDIEHYLSARTSMPLEVPPTFDLDCSESPESQARLLLSSVAGSPASPHSDRPYRWRKQTTDAFPTAYVAIREAESTDAERDAIAFHVRDRRGSRRSRRIPSKGTMAGRHSHSVPLSRSSTWLYNSTTSPSATELGQVYEEPPRFPPLREDAYPDLVTSVSEDHLHRPPKINRSRRSLDLAEMGKVLSGFRSGQFGFTPIVADKVPIKFPSFTHPSSRITSPFDTSSDESDIERSANKRLRRTPRYPSKSLREYRRLIIPSAGLRRLLHCLIKK